MDLSDCQSRRVLPDLRQGAAVSTGSFVHNVEASKASFRYPRSTDLGRGVKGWRLNWSKDGTPTLSVNQLHCVTCPCCSIILDKHPDKHGAVVQFNLPALSSLLGVKLTAVYSPVCEADYQNPCHFDIVVDDGVSWDFLEASLKRILQSPTNGADGWPSSIRNPQERAQAHQRKSEHDEAYLVMLDPCEKN